MARIRSPGNTHGTLTFFNRVCRVAVSLLSVLRHPRSFSPATLPIILRSAGRKRLLKRQTTLARTEQSGRISWKSENERCTTHAALAQRLGALESERVSTAVMERETSTVMFTVCDNRGGCARESRGRAGYSGPAAALLCFTAVELGAFEAVRRLSQPRTMDVRFFPGGSCAGGVRPLDHFT